MPRENELPPGFEPDQPQAPPSGFRLDQQSISGPSGGPAINPLRLAVDERGRVADPARGAPASVIASASLLPDVQDQITAYANGMRMDRGRFGVDSDGHIIYSDPQNNGMATRVVPPGVTPYALSSVGPGITMAGGIAGSLNPYMGGAPGAAVGAGAADVGRQAVGRWINNLDDPITGINWAHAGGEGALNFGGQLAGRGIVSLFSRNPLGVSALDRIEATQDPQARAAWDRITGISQGRNPVTRQPVPIPGQPPGTLPPPIDLDLGQITGLPSLRATGRQARRWPQTMDAETARLENQQLNQVPARYRYEVGQNVGPATSIEDAAGRNLEFPGRDPVTNLPLPRPGIRGAAQDIIDAADEARTAAARPHYGAAYSSGVVPDVAPIVSDIDARLATGGGVARNSATAQALAQARTALTETTTNAQGQTVTRPSQSYEALGNAKLVIDNILRGMSRGANPPTAAEISAAQAELTPIQQRLTQTLYNAHPEWARGYDAYVAASPAVDAVRRDLGALARLDTPERLSVLNSVFTSGNVTPQQVARMRQAFLINGRMDEWNGGLAAWMEGRLQQALTPLQEGGPENVAGRLWRTFNTEGQQAVLRAALPQGAYQNLNAFFDVLNAARRFAPEGSTTTTDLAAVGPQAIGRGARILGNLTSPGAYLNAGNLAIDSINTMRTPEMRRRFVEAITSPDALRQLDRLRMLSPTSEQAIRIASQFISDLGAGAASPNPAARAPSVRGPGQ
jgi:hypothetical protein